MSSDIAVIGLGVMGSNLALNIADQGYTVSVYNRDSLKTHDFMQSIEPQQKFVSHESLKSVCDAFSDRKIILLMVAAGKAVDAVIEQLLPSLSEGDIVIDAGNSFYKDSERRFHSLKEKGIYFLGVGVSGGEEGARYGPSIMPGGAQEAWPYVEALFLSIAAKSDDGEPCCAWVGSGGAGHYVKMVHNGIEYGDMQLIAEAYHLMNAGLGMSEADIAKEFEHWNQGVMASYLIEITANILKVSEADGSARVKHILDAAGQKGTGLWTAVDALKLGVPLTLITEAVFSRALSSRKSERLQASKLLKTQSIVFEGDQQNAINQCHDALYAAKIISYTQGFMQMAKAAKEYQWELDFGSIAMLWRAGCIIRSRFLQDIKAAYDKDRNLANLLFDDFFANAMSESDQGWRATVSLAIQLGIAVPALSSSLAFYDGFKSAVLPANLIQAQRDYFGAHTYKKINEPLSYVYHSHWTGDHSEDLTSD